MTKVSKSNKISYNEYLNSLNKNEIIKILDIFKIDYKKNLKKQVYIDLVTDNLSLIVDKTLSIFQNDELHNIKLLIRKKGKVTIRINYLLHSFLKTLEKNKIVIEISPKTYEMPKELLDIFKRKINGKKVIAKIKENTKEYGLILGIIDAYGVIEYNKFYEIYSTEYKEDEVLLKQRISFLANFYSEFKVLENKNNVYIVSSVIKNIKSCNQFIKNKKEYAKYTAEELVSIHNFSYMNKYRSYKKLIKFIKRNYYVEKSNFKIVNNYVLIPFISQYQLNRENGIKILSTLIDDHFEFNNERHKKKFIDLIEKMALDYPSWELKGHSRRGEK